MTVRTMLTTITAIACCAIAIASDANARDDCSGGPACSSEPGIFVPDTVSPQARVMLLQLARAKSQPAEPPHDQAGWDARNSAMESFFAQFTQPVVSALSPTVTEINLGGVPALKVEAQGAKRNSRALIYVHGGGFTLFSARSSLHGAALMAARTQLPVYSVDYTLAPRATWNTITDQVVTA